MARLLLRHLLPGRPRGWAGLCILMCLILPVFVGPKLWLLVAILAFTGTAIGVHAGALMLLNRRSMIAPPDPPQDGNG